MGQVTDGNKGTKRNYFMVCIMWGVGQIRDVAMVLAWNIPDHNLNIE